MPKRLNAPAFNRNSLGYPKHLQTSDENCIWEPNQWEPMCTELVPSSTVSTLTLLTILLFSLIWLIMAVCTVRPHNIETQLNHYGNWLRTVTGSMSKIYNVIEIYIIIIILCFLIFPPLLSTTFPKPLLIHLQHLKKKHSSWSCVCSALSFPVNMPLLILFLSTYDLLYIMFISGLKGCDRYERTSMSLIP